MKNGIFVTFITNHKMVDSGLHREIEVKLEVPKYFPTGIKLDSIQIKQYISQRYGFEVLRLV